MTDQANTGSLTRVGAGEKILSLINEASAISEVKNQTQEAVEVVDDNELDEGELLDNETEMAEDTQLSEDDALDNADDADDAGDSDDAETEELYEVNVNGEKIEVTLEELKKGYQRDKDYTVKTQKVSEEMKLIEQQKQVFTSQLKPLIEDQEILTTAHDYVNAVLDTRKPIEPSEDLLDERDPSSIVRYNRAILNYKKQLERYNAEKETVKSYFEKRQGAAKKMQQAYQSQGQIYLKQHKPEVLENADRVMEHAVSKYGYTQEEISQVTDPRFFVMIYNDMVASTYRKPRPNKPNVRYKPTNKAKRNDYQNIKAQKQKALKDRASRSGGIKDVTAAIEALL